MRILNLAVLAHIDAGKTSLTERLLHCAGVIDEIGSVDGGSTQTDTLALERRRGITIKSAVVSFRVGDTTVNLIDTPGHPDFIAEVERVLSVLDGAVLVLSAVEGVQAQTRVLLRALRRLGIPTLIFANKIDRAGARRESLLRDIADKLGPAIVPMGTTAGLGTPGADFSVFEPDDPGFRGLLLDLLADNDERLTADFVRDESAVSGERLREELRAQTGQALVHPVFFGSAITGVGVDALLSGVVELLPSVRGDARAPLSGTVFKVERGPAGEKIAYARLFSGTVNVRDRPPVSSSAGPGSGGGSGSGGARGEQERITAISVFQDGRAVPAGALTAGRIGKVWGLGGVRIGDTIGAPGPWAAKAPQFSPPTLETVVTAREPADKGALHLALVQLAEQDPLINLRLDAQRREITVSLYGEVQKEVIEATLSEEYGLLVDFQETTTIRIERPVGVGEAVQLIGKGDNPFFGTVGLRIEPAPVGSGVRFRLGIELGSLPAAFMAAVEESARQALGQGLRGWEVTDCLVTMTHSGFSSIFSTAGDFRNLTPLVVMDALKLAGTAVYEPVLSFALDVPAGSYAAVLAALAQVRGVPRSSAPRGSAYVIEGEIPAGRVHDLERQLPGLTSGEGVLESAFDHYREVHGPVPVRARTDHNPLSWKEYLLHVVRRV